MHRRKPGNTIIILPGFLPLKQKRWGNERGDGSLASFVSLTEESIRTVPGIQYFSGCLSSNVPPSVPEFRCLFGG
jgi:hypothetical protein